MLRILFHSFVLLYCASAVAQDPQFTQYYSTPLYLNPSFAGDAEFARLNSAYRQQWPKIEGGYKTFHIGYDQYISKVRGGIAASYLYDNAASLVLQEHHASIAYAYHLQIKDKVVIKPSIKLGWQVKKLKLDDLRFGSQFDPTTGGFLTGTNENVSERINFFDLGFGLLSYYKGLFAGASFDHVNRPNTSFYEDEETNLTLKYSAHVGYNQKIIRDFKMGISFFYMKQKPSDMKIISACFKYKWAKIDVGYRKVAHINTDKRGESVLFAAGYESERIQIGYSFDYTVSELTLKTSGGAHEATLIYIMRPKGKAHSILTVNNSIM